MKGFTLIEILLVIAIVLTVGFLSSAYPLRFTSRMALYNSSDEIKSALWKAQAYAMGGRQHSAWGVHYENSVLTVFKGDNYGNRDQNFDEKMNIDNRVSVTGFSDAVFFIPGGKPQAPIQNIVLSCDELSKQLALNIEGVLE